MERYIAYVRFRYNEFVAQKDEQGNTLSIINATKYDQIHVGDKDNDTGFKCVKILVDKKHKSFECHYENGDIFYRAEGLVEWCNRSIPNIIK
jgi:hypothetical protein